MAPRVREALDAIAALGPDWNGYGAGPFGEGLVGKARRLAERLPGRPGVFPTARDSIQFEYEAADGSYLEFEVYADRTDCLFVPGRDYGRSLAWTETDDEAGRMSMEAEAFRRCVSPA